LSDFYLNLLKNDFGEAWKSSGLFIIFSFDPMAQ